MAASPSLTLRDAVKDLQIVEDGLPAAKERLIWVRQQGQAAASIALANGADPDAGDAGRLRAMLASCCDGIEYAISEAEKHTAIVRAYLAEHADAMADAAPATIDASWQRFVSAFHHAQKELNQLSRVA
jgi:hypothetical protein